MEESTAGRRNWVCKSGWWVCVGFGNVSHVLWPEKATLNVGGCNRR